MSDTTFADLNLPADILQAVQDMGFVTPTPIQEQAIPHLLDKHDVVGVAQTGTGKTAAFGLPLLALVEPHAGVQALVLAPTRELALQTAESIEQFANRSRGVNTLAVYGGSPYGPQLGALKKGVEVVVGTPGRVIDLIKRGALDLSTIRMFVLDEADEMLRMGFAEDVETIASSVPDDRVTALFSATMPAAIAKVAEKHLSNPVNVSVSRQSSTTTTVHQTYAVVPFKHKIGALSRVLATRAADAVLVFVRTRADAEEVSIDLTARGFRTAGISGDVAQRERERIVERLKDGSLDVLVATDVAARGLDVDRIGLVVNFDVPREDEAYVHRIGRTGRAGRSGTALTFFTPRESGRKRKIEKLTGVPLEEVAIPTPVEVSNFRARRMLDSLSGRIEAGRLDLYFDLLHDLTTTTDIDIYDIAAALLAKSVGDEGPQQQADTRGKGRIRREELVDDEGNFVAARFEPGRDEPRKAARHGGRRDVRTVHSPGQMRRYRVEVGHRDGVRPGAIVGAITNEGGVDGRDLGKIDIFPSFSLVEISGSLDEEASSRIAHATVSGRQLRISEDHGPKGGSERGDRRGDDRGGFKRSGFQGGRKERSGRGDKGGRKGSFKRRKF
ncbi:DEAD/DEAH box helicase [Boudabousia marimammalium]|uniref:RNA helicase n=1 Tax=Boudabousia marimammalium TaxID=156892 RepID=A0A1Q5PRN1_9ACTO|nr:DEAD/DEAH box helicase [Boudabousia marimammalium]OKL50102.1 ATP-dependent RNA helicase [Boudabousia marimammalium]